MRVLVTGARGFIGNHLCAALLQAGHDFVGFDVRTAGEQDVRDSMAWFAPSASGVDACVHLAAIAAPNEAARNPAAAWATNVQGTYNALRLCQELDVRRVVFMSSAHVYGISPRYMPTDEVHPLSLFDTYTSTKIAGERLCEQFYAHHGLSYCALRLFNAYGPGQSPDYFLGVKMREGKAGGPVTIRSSVEDTTKDFVYVADVVDAILRALGSDYVGALNVGTGVESRLRAVAQLVADAHEVPLSPVRYEGEGPTRMCADWRRAKRTIGWEPRVDLATGVGLTIGAMR